MNFPTSSGEVSSIETLAQWIQDSRRTLVFTGAGISTESGIPDFRSPGGVWSQNRTVYFEEFLNSEADRFEYWRQKSQTHIEFQSASPNVAHRILAKWEQQQRIGAIVTQNIDGLHQLAGSQDVLELHGTARNIGCLSCDQQYPADPLVRQFLTTDQIPSCPACGGLLKHATISFGQALPDDVFRRAIQLAQTCELCLVLGSSLVVYPAASIPESARRCGAKLVIVNRTETPLDSQADLVIRAGLGDTLSCVDQSLSEHAGPPEPRG